MQVMWAIIVGAIAGFIARWISPSPNNPQGFVLTTVLGIVGSVVATFLGRAIHPVRSRPERRHHRLYHRCSDRLVGLARAGDETLSAEVGAGRRGYC